MTMPIIKEGTRSTGGSQTFSRIVHGRVSSELKDHRADRETMQPKKYGGENSGAGFVFHVCDNDESKATRFPHSTAMVICNTFQYYHYITTNSSAFLNTHIH